MTTTSAAQSFINVGERTNVTGSAKFRKLIEANDYPAALAVARQQVEAGAMIFVVCNPVVFQFVIESLTCPLGILSRPGRGKCGISFSLGEKVPRRAEGSPAARRGG